MDEGFTVNPILEFFATKFPFFMFILKIFDWIG